MTDRRIALRIVRRRYGSAFSLQLPIFGNLVVLSDPNHIRQLLRTGAHVADTTDANLGRVMGPNSLFALSGDQHRAQCKLLTPPFHGRRLAAYEAIVEAEASKEFSAWPHDRPFATLPAMMRITLNVILRAMFGADGAELERLREILPGAIKLGSTLSFVPVPQWDWGRWSPWGRFYRNRREYDGSEELLHATILEVQPHPAGHRRHLPAGQGADTGDRPVDAAEGADGRRQHRLAARGRDGLSRRPSLRPRPIPRPAA